MSDKLSVIIPAYNEENHIENTIKETVKTLNSFGIDYEIIIVDDGSKDKTFEKATNVSKNIDKIKVFRYEKNKGKGNAIIYGFKNSTGNLITFIDADLDLHPKQIKTFLKYMKKYNADIVVGSKRHPKSKLNYPFYRKFLSTAYYLMNKILFGLPVKDTQAGLKLYKREIIEKIFPKLLVKRYAADLEMLVVSKYFGYKIVEAPIVLNFQRFKTRVSLKDIIKILIDTLAIFYRIKIIHFYQHI